MAGAPAVARARRHITEGKPPWPKHGEGNLVARLQLGTGRARRLQVWYQLRGASRTGRRRIGADGRVVAQSHLGLKLYLDPAKHFLAVAHLGGPAYRGGRKTQGTTCARGGRGFGCAIGWFGYANCFSIYRWNRLDTAVDRPAGGVQGSEPPRLDHMLCLSRNRFAGAARIERRRETRLPRCAERFGCGF